MDGKGERRHGQPSAGAAADRDVESACISAGEREQIDAARAAAERLLIGYSEALDCIATKPGIVFLPHRFVPRGRLGWRILVPDANFMAMILAEVHVAARVDTLLRRGRRFRALDPAGPSPLDLDRLQDLRDSLSPVRRRTLTLWVVLLALAVAFPVAWITDRLRALAPEAIVCSTRFSVRDIIAKVEGISTTPVTTGCGTHARASLVGALVRVAHLNLSPGSVIDAFASVRASGLVVVLLLAVVWTLCLSIVLLVFRSGFRLKRCAFSIEQEGPARLGLPIRLGIRSGDLYLLERKGFAAVGLRSPREFPLDLAVSAGMLVLPLTIAADLLTTATAAKLDLATTAVLAVAALALIAVVLVRLQWLVQIWHGRIGLKVIRPRERRLPDGSAVLVRNGAYGAVLLGAGYIAWEITAAAAPSASVPLKIASLLFFAPALAWPLSVLWWYRLHRELASCGRCVGLRIVRAPILSVVPSLTLAGAVAVYFFWVPNPSGGAYDVFVVLTIIGFAGVPVSIYRMGRSTQRLRLRATPHKHWNARAAGVRAAAMLVMPASMSSILLTGSRWRSRRPPRHHTPPPSFLLTLRLDPPTNCGRSFPARSLPAEFDQVSAGMVAWPRAVAGTPA